MTAPVTPWYRQAWPWFLISLPATAVIAGSFTFYLAVCALYLAMTAVSGYVLNRLTTRYNVGVREANV